MKIRLSHNEVVAAIAAHVKDLVPSSANADLKIESRENRFSSDALAVEVSVDLPEGWTPPAPRGAR